MKLLKQLTALEQFGTVEHIHINSVVTISMSGTFNIAQVASIFNFIVKYTNDGFPNVETIKIDTKSILIVLKP
jgi:hypothetical protein